MIFFKDNKEVGSIVGGVDEKTLDDAITKIA